MTAVVGAGPAAGTPVPHGDVDAEFTAFVQARGHRLRHGAELLTGDPVRADDLLQHALVGTYLRWRHVRAADPESYVRRAMLNHYLDWRRRLLARELPLADGAGPVGEDPAVDVVRRDAIQRALSVLTRRERAVVVLRYWFDLSEQQIAAELGIRPGTVKSTASRALARLRTSPDVAFVVPDGGRGRPTPTDEPPREEP